MTLLYVVDLFIADIIEFTHNYSQAGNYSAMAYSVNSVSEAEDEIIIYVQNPVEALYFTVSAMQDYL